MSDIIYKMNIIDFCNSNNIKWFPIILDENKTPISINNELYKRTKKDGSVSYTPHYIEFSNIHEHILEERQNLLYTNEIYDYISKPNHSVKIAIDTNEIFQIDIDTPHIDERILYNWIKNNDTKSAYYKSITKDYGFHIFIKLNEFHDYIKNFTSTKNRFQFKQQFISNDGSIIDIFKNVNSFGGVELLTGQWAYANIDVDVHNENITNVNKNYVPFWSDLLQINKIVNNNTEVYENINRYENQEIYDHMNNISQIYIDKRDTHFKIICALLSAGYDNIAIDCMYRSSNTKNKDLNKEFESFKKSNNNSISIKTLFYYSKISHENKYYELLKKHRGVHLRQEYKKEFFSLNFITDTLNNRFLPYSILENIDTNLHTITHIKSHLGSGKTTIIKKFIKNNPNIKKILYFAPRILFARDIYNDLKEYDFKLYSKMKKTDYDNTERIVIQLESLWKIRKQNFDLIIVDEVESVLKQLTSKITNKNIVETYKNFQYLINNCKTIITADAFLSNNSINIINSIKQNAISKIIVNNFNPYKRKAYEIDGFDNLIEKAINQIKKNERIVFITMIKNNGDYAYNQFKLQFPNKKIKYYYGSMNEKDKTFDNINEEWKDVDILIYTPIITCGVNYSFESFHSLYLWISPNSCCIRDLFQSSLRVRKLINNDCYFAFNYGVNRYSKKCEIISKIFENSEGNILNIYKNLFEKQEYLIQLGIAIPNLCKWGIENLSYFIYEDYISNNHIVETTHEYLRLCGYEIYPLEILPNPKNAENNKTCSFCPPYAEIDDINEYDATMFERDIYNLNEEDKYKLIKYKFDNILNSKYYSENIINIYNSEKSKKDDKMPYLDFESVFSYFHNKIGQLENFINEVRNKKSKIDIINICENNQHTYDLYLNTNIIQDDLNNKILNVFGVSKFMNLKYTTSDIMNNLDSISTIIQDAQKFYNFRKCRAEEKNIKYINACIKHVLSNTIGVDLQHKQIRKNKKRQYEYRVELNKPQKILLDVIDKIDKFNNENDIE